MNDRAFRLDFLVAIGALLISAVTAGAMIYQTRVMGDQYASAIWPYLSVTSTYGYGGLTIDVANNGLGPALVESAGLSVDGKEAADWNAYAQDIVDEPDIPAILPSIKTASIGPSSTIRPGDSRTLFAISYPGRVPIAALERHHVAIDICYCSLNRNCWLLRAKPGQDDKSTPQAQAVCSGSSEIKSNSALIRLRSSR